MVIVKKSYSCFKKFNVEPSFKPMNMAKSYNKIIGLSTFSLLALNLLLIS